MFANHPAFPSRAQRHALIRAEERDTADLQTLASIAAILRRTLAELGALPPLEHPDPTYCLEDTVRTLEDELSSVTGWAELLARQPTLVEDEPDDREYEWEDAT